MPPRRILIAIAILATFVAMLGACLAFAGPSNAPSPADSPSASRTDPGHRSPPGTTSISPVEKTDNPETFAVSVASALFDWDTTTAIPLSDYTGRILAVADPSGEESAGLVTDLATYLPSPASWADLRGYRVRQWIDINSYAVPDSWDETRADDAGRELAAGTTAFAVSGLRRRSGIWQGEQAQTVERVTFTVFITCRPTYDECKLLRLSQLNHPLP
ncbi:cell wall protein [Nocardioides sp. NPDC057772]|uniref:hypothetical protein n=1 Tax=Nocardioides sp. NPDC057772 TaxID=3346245 RepID=UPI0002028B5C|nr:hypothetical protein NBCG_02942 [Nocardioidaceae bacterium Broad-1]